MRVVTNLRIAASRRRFFEKKRAKNFIRLATPVGRRGRVANSRARSAVMKFFASFCSQKKALLLPLGTDIERQSVEQRRLLRGMPGG
jgi:hypothetical protein